ncbi:MAG: hypothetical protein A2189_07680, partial [Paenibacillus sp. RIFOXYA1_FULL_44_5]
PYMTPYSLSHQLQVTYTTDSNGGGTLVSPPAGPDSEYVLGTDRYGYDLYTQMLYGAKYTMFASIIVAIMRVGIGAVFGMLFGYYDREKYRMKWTAGGLNGIPIFMIAYFTMLGISINSSLSPFTLTVVICILLIALGIPSITSTYRDKTIHLKKQPYIMAASALGAGHQRIIFRHIFPQFHESLLLMLVNEVILVLAIFGQLSIFHIFIGGTIIPKDDLPISYLSVSHEWSGMIGSARDSLMVYPWMIYFPLLAYVILILGLYLLSKGLEELYRDRYNKFSHI